MMKNQTISIWPTRIKLDHALSRLVNVKNRRCKNVKNNFSKRPNARNNLRINRPPNALFFRRCNPFFLLFLFFFFAARYDLETTICMQPRASAAINSVILSWRRGRYRVSARKDRAYASIKRNCYSLPSAPPPAKGMGRSVCVVETGELPITLRVRRVQSLTFKAEFIASSGAQRFERRG